jgi:prepilin-type N-terminal cleavage/methylation domain-containing protein
MNSKLKKQTEGFTIIEVLIVLAIAGLIMLIVFLAVPALQRNSRNTQRKNDVSSLVGAITEVLNNNNGAVSSLTNASLVAAAPTPAYYDFATASNLTVGAGAQTNSTTVDTISVRTGAKCSSTDAAAGSSRQVALLYTIEPAVKQCRDI